MKRADFKHLIKKQASLHGELLEMPNIRSFKAFLHERFHNKGQSRAEHR